MLNVLEEFPFLFATLRIHIPAKEEKVTATLRLLRHSDGRMRLALRVSQGSEWNLDNPIHFESCGNHSIVTAVESTPSNLFLRAEIGGWFRNAVTSSREFIRNYDFFRPLSQPVTAQLELSFQDRASDALTVGGSIRIEEGFHFAKSLQMSGILQGSARLYSTALPSIDRTRQVRGILFLPIQVFLIEVDGAAIASRDRQIEVAQRIWGRCGIQVEPAVPDVRIQFTSQELDTLISGPRGLAPLRQEIVRRRAPRSPAIPVIITPRGTGAGGGETVGHGTRQAVVVIRDQECRNDTLLAHELGHVLGGKEASGCTLGEGYWCSNEQTLMDGGETLCQAAPEELGSSACEYASCFARYREERVS